ncbi:hypothetical protein BDA96_06G257400 [Sorghum bicolor]|uniref:Uncharacterized protein n=2 Tax=Sorghum bicolor TaxID=4558 RepID=A0A921QUY7_SORBI|nr:hypothetical protein BDA96_06G257400 [Sorghum bicolor]KXG27234.1 hypothetical protein SORBI_3006G235100 [Sorghum bicolor]
MANFAAQIKDKFLGLVDRVAGYGRIGGEKDKVQEPAKLHSVQRVEVRSRGAEPVVGEGSTAGAN